VVVFIALMAGAGAVAWRPDAAPVIWHKADEPLAPPDASAPADAWNAWALREVSRVEGDEAKALLAGDEAAYLAAADPDDARLGADLKRRFEVLRQMGVGQWTQSVKGNPKVTGQMSWHADINVTYCFGDPKCRPNALLIGTDWRLAKDHIVLTAVEQSGKDQVGPRPWEAADLTVAAGARTVVATSSRLDRRLTDTLAAAEKAAAVADTLARWAGPPSRYVVFVATTSDWTTWYGYQQPDWAAGVYVNQTDNEVVVNGPVVPLADTQNLLTHELTHVATLAGKRLGLGPATWWLVEGIAEYATMIGQPVRNYNKIDDARTFVAQGWNGNPAVERPSFDASTVEAGGRYGVAFLSMRRMADVYGQDKMLDFFGRVVHDGMTLDAAATAVYGVSWATVATDLTKFIRNA
jgi:hypothetical protein